MVAAVAARFGPHAPAGLAGEGLERLRCVMLGPSRSSAPAARYASARDWSRIAFSPVKRSFGAETHPAAGAFLPCLFALAFHFKSSSGSALCASNKAS